MSRFALAAMLAAAVSASACGNSTPTTPTTPTTTPIILTDTFSGTLARNAATTYQFSVSGAGVVSATLTSVSDPAIAIGLSLGAWNGSSCAILLANDQALQGVTVTGTASNLGTLCARVYDVGRIVDPVDYVVTVTHP